MTTTPTLPRAASSRKASSVSTVYGYPRQGPHRELKFATEAYWSGRTTAEDLLEVGRSLRASRRAELAEAGLGELPSNDFSYYDHVLDTAWMLGAIPERFVVAVPDVSTPAGQLDRYFAMARGATDVQPLEMTKWFSTNYHYLVPELSGDSTFALDAGKPIGEFLEAKADGVLTRPVILGPISFLLLSKPDQSSPGFEPLALADRLVPLYCDLLDQLHSAGAEWVQLDEPCLVQDQPAAVLTTFARVYERIAAQEQRPRILIASYFDHLGESLPVLARLNVEGLAMDFTGPAAANLQKLAAIGGLPGKRLVAGVIDGHNVWAADLPAALGMLGTLLGLAKQVDVAASCSLLHVPVSVTLETGVDPQIAGWLSFARQKIGELAILARGLSEGTDAIAGELRVGHSRRASRESSPIVRNETVRKRLADVDASELRRDSSYPNRRLAQRQRHALPALPTTTIGSFPQTAELRAARAALRRGELSLESYEDTMRQHIAGVVAEQEQLGLDVLVHGEPERNDMVQYFAEQLNGFLSTEHGWVQSYGSRYVRPPILVGDVWRADPMTVRWATYAQGLTAKPLKGMLTGPVTMLAWSFVRDDQPSADTARQVALALRDEVTDLEAAGIPMIQVDEPALRETLPLRKERRADYLSWAVDSFRLATSGVRDDVQIHTHMCYAEFGDVLQAIIDMDADVISLEAARSQMAIVADLARSAYPNELGPGVWDIHSPRVPSTEEIIGHLRAAAADFPKDRLWVNPDCGLKTRDYSQVRPSLANLVAAAHAVRRHSDS